MPIYFTPDDHGLPLYFQSIGSKWAQGMVNRETGFPYFHWLQTESGVGIILINGNWLRLEEGVGILISPLTAHTYKPEIGSWHTSFISFYGTLRHDIHKIVGHEPYIIAKNTVQFCFNSWIDSTINKYLQQNTALEDLSIECYRFLSYIGSAQEKRIPQKNPTYLKYVAPVINNVAKNYADELALESLAKTVYVTPQYLSRLFRQYLNLSVHEYILNYRINKAKELLLNRPELAVKDIGIMVGMHTISHFISVFKKRVGFTPLEFRRLH